MYILNKPYLFSADGIKVILDRHPGATYMGPWCIKSSDGGWTNDVVEVFYEPNPDTTKGHSHYFGIFRKDEDRVFICNAESAFSQPITGILADNGEVVVSRYRHGFTTSEDGSVSADGGRDYDRFLWTGPNRPKTVNVVVDGPEFRFEEIPVESTLQSE